jgi:hypothetical protein
MIINFYLPESEQRLLEQVRRISEARRRSVSFVMREALESYCLAASRRAGRNPKPRRVPGEPKAEE